mmetsp:Transcript_28481/g.73154  ORF Transcript_28481/g.73154 Transcript_28481/m.73154 type:complete len:245 (-) Transcript_28481:490-1224(-)
MEMMLVASTCLGCCSMVSPIWALCSLDSRAASAYIRLVCPSLALWAFEPCGVRQGWSSPSRRESKAASRASSAPCRSLISFWIMPCISGVLYFCADKEGGCLRSCSPTLLSRQCTLFNRRWRMACCSLPASAAPSAACSRAVTCTSGSPAGVPNTPAAGAKFSTIPTPFSLSATSKGDLAAGGSSLPAFGCGASTLSVSPPCVRFLSEQPPALFSSAAACPATAGSLCSSSRGEAEHISAGFPV